MEISYSCNVKASSKDILDLFKLLSDDPTNYKMDSHEGVFPIEGRINEVGGIFETREKFLGVTIRLRFQTIEVSEESGFGFKVIKPSLFSNLKGYYIFEEAKSSSIILTLRIMRENTSNIIKKIISGVLFIFPFKKLIERQITKEVLMVKDLVEQRQD